MTKPASAEAVNGTRCDLRLAYYGIKGDRDRWREFGTSILGLQALPCAGAEPLLMRVDQKAFAFCIEEDPKPAISFLGYEARTEAVFESTIRAVHDAGFSIRQDDASRRQCARVAAFTDPTGIRTEILFGQETPGDPFVSPRGFRFVTGSHGIGHSVIGTSAAEKMLDLYRGPLGFRVSDVIPMFGADWVFLHCNQRHHTMCVGKTGDLCGFDHIMLELHSVDEVGQAFDTAFKVGLARNTLGRHSNDLMLSFYCQTPAGFTIEVGAEGRLIDDTKDTEGRYLSMSLWGHNELGKVR